MNIIRSDILEMQFFNQNLLAFVDVNQTDWTLKTKFNESLPLTPDALKMFELSQIITAMFFPEPSSHINVAFSLQQTAFMPIIKKLNLNINGQTLSDELGSRNINHFFWPGNSSEAKAEVIMNSVNGQTFRSAADGSWAWFRLLNRSEIKPLKNSQNFAITFNIDGNAARYHLTAENPINPFIPGVISMFQCPASLKKI